MFILLLTIVNADFFVGLRLHDMHIDVFNISQGECNLMYTLIQSCSSSYNFSTNNFNVNFIKDHYTVHVINDSHAHTIYNPSNKLPNYNMTSHFVNTIYTVDDINMTYINTSYDVNDYNDTLLFSISNTISCMSSGYDVYFTIYVINTDIISEYIVLAHIITYMYQYDVKCNDITIVLILTSLLIISLLILCCGYAYYVCKSPEYVVFKSMIFNRGYTKINSNM